MLVAALSPDNHRGFYIRAKEGRQKLMVNKSREREGMKKGLNMAPERGREGGRMKRRKEGV